MNLDDFEIVQLVQALNYRMAAYRFQYENDHMLNLDGCRKIKELIYKDQVLKEKLLGMLGPHS